MECYLQTSTFCNKCMRTLRCDSNLRTLTSFSLLVSFTKQKVAVCKPYLSPYCHPMTDPFRLLNPLWNTWWLKSLAPHPPPPHPLIFTVSCYMSHIVHCGANVSWSRSLVQWSWNIWVESGFVRFENPIVVLYWQVIVIDDRYRRNTKWEQVCEWINISTGQSAVTIWKC
jgi:hypothetical protein